MNPPSCPRLPFAPIHSILALSSFLAILLAPLATGHAGSSATYTPVVGFLRFDCPAGSDTIVSLPFHRTPRWEGALASAATNLGNGVFRLSLQGFVGFGNGELTSHPHWLLCRDSTGPEGRHFKIVAHGSDSVDLAADPSELGTLGSGSLVSIIPAWTLDYVFPPGGQTTFHSSTGPLATQRGSELLFFDESTPGASLAPSRRFYVTPTGWQEVGTFREAGDTIVAPGQAFVVRHPSGVDATVFVPSQQVYGGIVSIPVRIANGKVHDTMVAPPRPVAVSLDQVDLGPGIFEESVGTAPADRRDELLVFDQSAPGKNKTPAATFYRSGGQWLRDGTNAPSGNTIIEPSAGILLRKASGAGDETLIWANAPVYDVAAP